MIYHVKVPENVLISRKKCTLLISFQQIYKNKLEVSFQFFIHQFMNILFFQPLTFDYWSVCQKLYL